MTPPKKIKQSALGALLAACLLLPGTPGAASPQTQTVDGAKRFLALVFDRGMDVITLFPDGEPDRNRVMHSASSADECAFRFDVMRKGKIMGDGIFFKDVISIRQNGTAVDVVYRVPAAGETWTGRYEIGSADLAARVTYAFEFLHQRCDPTNGTGF